MDIATEQSGARHMGKLYLLRIIREMIFNVLGAYDARLVKRASSCFSDGGSAALCISGRRGGRKGSSRNVWEPNIDYAGQII